MNHLLKVFPALCAFIWRPLTKEGLLPEQGICRRHVAVEGLGCASGCKQRRRVLESKSAKDQCQSLVWQISQLHLGITFTNCGQQRERLLNHETTNTTPSCLSGTRNLSSQTWVCSTW